MTCKHCGGSIPEGGKFCPECGTPVAQKAGSTKKAPRTAHSARPLADNPFQPARRPLAEAADILDEEDAPEESDISVDTSEPIPAAPRPRPKAQAHRAEPIKNEDAAEDAAIEDVPATDAPKARPKKRVPVRVAGPTDSAARTAVPRPRSRPASASVETEKSESAATDGAPKARPKKHLSPISGAESAVVAHKPHRETDESRSEPNSEAAPQIGANRSSIAPPPPGSRKVNTMVPKRISPEDREMDEFFGGSGDDELDDEESLSFFERNLRGIITIGLLVATFLVLICWLTLSGSGKVFMAGLGITRNAQAYKLLGDQLMSNEQIKSASDAYYQALKYDPDNYEYAMLSAEAFYALQDKELAAKAAQLAISLEPNERAPYDLLAEMFPATSRPANIAEILEEGAALFNDPALAQ